MSGEYLKICKVGALFKISETDLGVVAVKGIGSVQLDAKIDHLGDPLRNADQVATYIQECSSCQGIKALCFLWNYKT